MPRDKQLRSVKLERVLQKRKLDQALNAKEFAVLAAISYSTARDWFRVPGFPVFQGHVFWQDFVRWRSEQMASGNGRMKSPDQHSEAVFKADGAQSRGAMIPTRAAKLLEEAGVGT
jgi:hypothetical protein